MYTPPSQKHQLVKQILTYIFMTLSVVAIVFVLVLFMLGYRFNQAEGTLEQGGLVQFNSIPGGAAVSVDSVKMGGSTPSKTTLAAGEHAVSMTRSGYETWQKTVDVKSGTILWLSYTRLIPTDLNVSKVADLKAVTSTASSPSRKWLAMTTEPTVPAITLADIGGDTPSISTITLPEATYTAAENKTGESFRLFSWDASNRYILMRHDYDEKNEWIVVDTQNVANSKNLTSLFDIAVRGAKFSQNNGRILYVLMDGDIRKIDTEAETMSAPLVRNVAEFSLYDKSILTYVTKVNETTKHRTVGYYQDGAASPRTIRTYSDDGSMPLHISIGKYYDQTYVGIAYGNTFDILSGSLPRSDSDEASSLTAVATMTMPAGIDYLSNKTDGRFFVAQHGMSYSVYDLELQKLTTTTLKGTTPLEGELRWLDGYYVWSSLGGTLRLYEFDGANQHDIMPIVAGQNPVISPNNRYLYAPTQDDKGAFHLSRVRLVLP